MTSLPLSLPVHPYLTSFLRYSNWSNYQC